MNNPETRFFDGHNDTLTHIHLAKGGKRDFFKKSDIGHIDLPRALQGGFGGGFFAIFPPPHPSSNWSVESSLSMTADGYKVRIAPDIEHSYARSFTDSIIENIYAWQNASEGKFRVALSHNDLVTDFNNGIVAAILHFEGAETIEPDLTSLEDYYQRGLRSLGIVWSRPNAFGSGVPFEFPSDPDIGPGLTEYGKDLVRACNRLGIMIDLSHLNAAGFWDVAELSAAPLVATHSGAHTLCRSTRNLTDEQLDAIGQSKGVVGVNFAKSFLRADGDPESPTPLTEIVRHTAYIVERIGIDHVAFGSDFDGAQMPTDLRDVADLPLLAQALRDHGFDADEVRKLTHENWFGVLRRTWKA